MSKKSTSVYAITLSQEQTEKIVLRLKSEGFTNDRISVLFADKSTTADFAHEKNTKAPEGAVAGGLSGGVLGGALGWIAGIGALAIPGFGPFIAAGPLAAAVGGAFVGASVGSIAGALVGMGIPEIEAKRFENKLKNGNILISVHAKNDDEINLAKDILKEHDAADICTAKMAKSDDDDHKRDANPGSASATSVRNANAHISTPYPSDQPTNAYGDSTSRSTIGGKTVTKQ